MEKYGSVGVSDRYGRIWECACGMVNGGKDGRIFPASVAMKILTFMAKLTI